MKPATKNAPPPDLGGVKVLIVEDEFYLAMEITDLIKGAGGIVVGPCPDVAAALSELQRARPDCALVDINLGNGPSFEVAVALATEQVPYVLLTGYDAAAIPREFSHIIRIEKPANMAQVLYAVGRITGRA